MIKTIKLLPKLLPLFALFTPVATQAAAKSKPNIVFIISDDQRWDCLGAAGNPNISTPNMDRLAREGVYFKQATISNPQCACSRALLLTGLASHSNGRYSNQRARKDILDPHGFDKYDCLPEEMAKNGYHTALVGKWHCYADPWNVGFQEIGAWFPPGGGPYTNPKIAHGKTRQQQKEKGFLQQILGNSARDIIKNHADGKSTQPLFLWLATTAPHSPYQPNPEEAMAPYKGKAVKDVLPPTYKGNLQATTAKSWVTYVTAVKAVDLEIGKVLKALDDNNMTSNTVIAFLGDNGYMMGSHNWNGKIVPYEDSIRVPMIFWGPGVIDGNGVTDAVASSLDLPPTFVKLSGSTPPVQWHGRDLTPVLKDTKEHGTTWSVSESSDYDNWKFPGIAYRTVRTKDSKLIIWHEKTGRAPEFYDISNDPHEEKNLYADTSLKPRVDDLTGILNKWMKDTDDSWTMRGETVQIGGKGKNIVKKGLERVEKLNANPSEIKKFNAEQKNQPKKAHAKKRHAMDDDE